MKLAASLALLAVAATAPHLLHAQAPRPQTFTDPANLAGERVTPLNGHELPIDQGAPGLAQLLRKLNTRASILNIVAHPDDEDGGMLTLYARGLGARVADLALTRGEGGQNFVTGDFEDALGLIRTQELLANDRYTGVTQMFGTEVDFGFSKTREESFQKWGHDRVLYDAVRAIRIYRPLVITATFIGNVTDGHGQHQVSGEIAQEAFKAAADPNVFPELTAEGILPWQALKVYARVPFADINTKGVYDYATNEYVPARFTNYVTGKVATTKPNADINVPEGDTDPLLTAAATGCYQSALSTEPTHNSVISTEPANKVVISTEAQRSGETCSSLATNPTPQLSYMQFARIGLSLQRTQISRNMPLPGPGPHNSGYTLYGSVLCNAPANARDPNIAYAPVSEADPANHSVILSGAKDPCSLPAAALPPSALTTTPSSRSDTPTTNASSQPDTLTTNASSQPDTSTTDASSRPERSAVERPLYLNAAYTPTNLSAQPVPSAATNRYPEASASGLTPTEETGALAPGYAPNEVATPHDLITQPTFFTGIDTSIQSIATLAPSAPSFLRTQLASIATNIDKATRDYNASSPSTIASSLAEALKTDDALINQLSKTQIDPLQKANALHELRIKRAQLNEALEISLGLSLDAVANSANQIADSSIIVKTHLSQTSNVPVTFQELFIADSLGIAAPAPPSRVTPKLDSAHAIDTAISISPRDDTHITRPYFHREQIEQPVYELIDPELRNAPSTPPAFVAAAIVGYSGARIMLFRIVHDGPQPISIIPPVSIASAPSNTVLPTTSSDTQPEPRGDLRSPSRPLRESLSTTAQLTATLTTEAQTSANINVQSPKDWTIQAKPIPSPATDPTHSIDFILHPPAAFTDPAIFHLTATTPNHHAYTEGWRAVGYPGLILTNYYTPATTRVVPVGLKLPSHDRIAYLPGTGDAVPQALTSIGLNPTLINVADLTPTKLSNFDTVVLGVRSYTAHPDLQGAPTIALLDFARNGGNVVVQYQTSDFTSADAPYPLDLGPGAKVVVETDPVKLLTTGAAADTTGVAAGFSPRSNGHNKNGALAPAPTSNPLLTTPNQITSADFNNWIEERGHGFLETWDPHYTALTETHDPGGDGTLPQAPQRGGLITTQVGRGRWTYVAFALYRQLPEAVPGAFRLFVNLVTPPTR